MTIPEMMTPLARVVSVSATDTVRDVFDRLERHGLNAAPVLDHRGRYVGTVTEAELRRHVARSPNRIVAFAAKVSSLARAHNPAVTFQHGLAALGMRALLSFVPVVDAANRLIGIIPRGRILALGGG